MSRRRVQPLDNKGYQNQEVRRQKTGSAQPGATYHPSSSDEYIQPFEIQAAEEFYSLQDNPHRERRRRTEEHDVRQPSAPSKSATRPPRTEEVKSARQIPGFANRGHLGGNRKPPPSPILTGRVHKPEGMPRRSPRNVDRPRPNYVDTSKAQGHKTSPLGYSSTTRSGSRSETKRLAENTVRGMQIPDNVQVSKEKKNNIGSAEKRAQMDKASMTRMATATRLFHENPRAKPYFHNMWHEERNAAGQIERHAEKVLFFGHLDNFEDVSAVISPDRRYFLLRQEEIDQKADIAPISWAGFSADPRLRINDSWGAINYQAVMQLQTKENHDGGARVAKHGRTLRLLERRDELDALTPDEREKVFNVLRKDMPITPVSPGQESKGHDGKSGFFHRSSKRDKKQKQVREKWERGMLSNEEVVKLQVKGTLPKLQRSRQERKVKGPVTALYEYDWEAEMYPNEKKLSKRK